MTEPTDLIARLRPAFVSDLPVQHAVDKLREEEMRNTALSLSRWLVENNELKREAADRLASVTAERDALQIKLDACNEHARIVTHERDWAQEVDVKAAELRADEAEAELTRLREAPAREREE